MNITREIIPADSFGILCVTLTPASPRGSVVEVHGYGGCKEEQLGLAWRIAEIGLKTSVIDLTGHGEHMLPLDHNVLQDVEMSIDAGADPETRPAAPRASSRP